jgi:general secretion pathway protein C
MIPRMVTVTPPAGERNLFGTLIVAALVIVLAYQLAHWTWIFATPREIATAAPSAGASADIATAAKLFGGNASQAAASGASTLRLKGVVAPTPGVAASAIFSTGAPRDVSIFVGSDVQPGVKLKEVHPDHVILARAGIDERIDLEAPKGSPVSSQPARMVGFKINVARTGANNYSFSRKELDDALRDPNQLNYLGQIGMPPGGGVRMEQAPPGSLAQKLGLQPGDVIKKVNGQPVASTGDLARLYTQFNTLSSVQAEVQRGGTTVQLTYAIQ